MSLLVRPTDYRLTIEDDAFVRDLPRWVAELDDGTSVYCDDGREPTAEQTAWTRLRAYCHAAGRRVVGLRIQFRSHCVWLPRDAPGYFLCRFHMAVYPSELAESHDGFVAGHLEGDLVHVTRYKVPELLVVGAEDRPADPDSPCLIVGHIKKSPGLS